MKQIRNIGVKSMSFYSKSIEYKSSLSFLNPCSLLNIPACIFVLSFLYSISLSAQRPTRYNLKLQSIDQTVTFIKKQFEIQPSFSDSLSVRNELNNILLQLYANAYLEASIDSIYRFEKTFFAKIFIGKKYEWASLKNGNVESAFLEQIGFRKRLYQNKDFYYKEVLKLQKSLLTYAENNGYPFAEVGLKNIRIKEGKVAAQLFMKKNRLIIIDGIKIKGVIKISPQYLENYLGFKNGDLYDKSKIDKVLQRIRELPFVQQEGKGLTITFKGNKATINLFLKKKKVSRFDFLVGVLPRTNNSASPSQRNFLITGTFNADMQNQFGLGERIFAEFQQLAPGTQELELQFTYPYILNFPFGVDFKFDLYKKDSSFLQVESDFGVQYLLEGGNYLKVLWNTRRTNLLTINESQIIAAKKLPEELDLTNSVFGLEYNLQKLDYRFNPRKGWGTLLRVGAGFKRIKENNTILGLETSDPNFTFQSLYDSLTLRTFQYQLEGKVEKYFPVFKRSTIKSSVTSGWIISQSPIFRNEQFRLGGNRLLRGFDEESIFTTNYVIGTLEYRLLIGQNSFLFAFGDYGYVENITIDSREYDSPVGIGAGITFETGIGVFAFSLAVGKQRGNPFDFRSVKSHFGYVSYF